MTKNKSALIFGVTGQDGEALSRFLLSKGYKVIGASRRVSDRSNWRIKNIMKDANFILENCDITDSGNVSRVINKYKCDEIYNLAAQSFVGLSWQEPIHTGRVTAMGAVNILEAIRQMYNDAKELGVDCSVKYYQAASSEMYGRVLESPQNENTPFNPLSPYAAAKCYAFHMTKLYRESYDMFCCNGILFNHESPNRGIEFVTRKITDGVARIKNGLQNKLALGNLEARRDWGHADDYVRAMWLMLQQDNPNDYVIATGETHSIREFLELAFSRVDLQWQDYVVQDQKYMRPNDVNLLLGDSSKAKAELCWWPDYTFKKLVEEMVDADMDRIRAALE